MPRIAVIVPAYGVAHLVGEALDSLLAQDFSDWECIVIDDGAPDDVAGAVEPYLSDSRIRLMRTENRGVSSARNTAIAASSAPLIALLDGDDRFRPAYLSTMAALFEDEPDIRLATCNAVIFGAVPRERLCFSAKQGSSDGLHGSLSDVLDRSFGVYIGTTFRREDFDRIGGFDTTMAQSEDFDLWVRLMQLGGPARYVDSILGEYRVRANSASSEARRMIEGNIKVYTKAQASLPANAPEHELLTRLMAVSERQLAFELAIDSVLEGHTRSGIALLRKCRSQVAGPVWSLSFALWTMIPALARPMLAWRRKAHSRGNQSSRGLGGLLHRASSL